MKQILAVAIAAAITFSTAAGAAQTISGSVSKVRDGDTIVVRGTPIRLNGVDAPETKTQAGRDAKTAMQRFLRGKNITCELNGERTYDRWVGVCFTDGGDDIGAVLIANGYALDCRRYSGGRYRSLEPAGARSRLPQASYC